MTVPVQVPEARSTASGSTGTFALGFGYEDASHVQVSVEVDGVETLLTQGDDFTVSGGNAVIPPESWPPAGALVRRWRTTPIAQGEEFGDTVRFQPVRNESAFDRLTRVAQDQAAGLARAVKVPIGETPPDPQAILDAAALGPLKADKTTTVTGAGLATGGGSLAANRTITVTEASEAEAQTGSAADKTMTPRRTTDHFNARTSTQGRALMADTTPAAARERLGAAASDDALLTGQTRVRAASSYMNEGSYPLRAEDGVDPLRGVGFVYDNTTQISATALFRVEEGQNASPGEAIAVNGQTINFVSSGAGTYDVTIGADYVATAAAVAAKINAYPGVFACTAVHDPDDPDDFMKGVVVLTAIAAGAAGNAITLSLTSSLVLPRIYLTYGSFEGGADIDAGVIQASRIGDSFKPLLLQPGGSEVLVGAVINRPFYALRPILDPAGGWGGSSFKELVTAKLFVGGDAFIDGALSINSRSIPEGGTESNYFGSDGVHGAFYASYGDTPLSLFLPVSYNETTSWGYEATGTDFDGAVQLAQCWNRIDYASADGAGAIVAIRLGAERGYIANRTFGREVKLYGQEDTRDSWYGKKEEGATHDLLPWSTIRQQQFEGDLLKGFTVMEAIGGSYGEVRNLFLNSMADGQTATGSTRADAAALPWRNRHYITDGGAGTGVIVPPAFDGAEVRVFNRTATAKKVYASGNDSLGGVSASTGIVLPAGASLTLTARDWINRADHVLTDPFSTVDGSPTLTVAHTSHGRAVGSLVWFETTPAPQAGSVPVRQLYVVKAVPNANSWEGTLPVDAEATESGVGGEVTVSYADGYWQVERGWRAAFRAHKGGTDQTGIVGSADVTFGTVATDVGGLYNTSTSAWTPNAGPVRLSATVRVEAGHSTGDLAYISLKKNGSAIAYGQLLEIDNGESVVLDIIDRANGTDAYSIEFQGSGNPITLSGAAAETYFQGHEL